MSWTDHVIWWHLHPLGFVDAEPTHTPQVTHRLGHIVNWLDYAIDLGTNGLLLAPIFASASHGYDTLDYYRIDPRLGDEADFDELLREAKERGFRVCLDGVFNHVSEDHEIVRRALDEGEGSEAGKWLKWIDGYPRAFEGNFDLVELNLAYPPVVDYIVDVMTHWLDRGIDGWRLDAAFAVGAATWRPIVERVKAVHPDAWIIAELIHGDYGDFVAESGVDSVTQYELWKATWSSLNDRNFHELEWTLSRHAAFSQKFRPQTFVGNHDTTRIATKITDPRHVPLAVALLMTLPGIPSIYAGDEQGFTGEKLDQAHGDDAVRPPFPLTPAGLAPYGVETFALYQRLVAIRRRHPWLVDANLATTDVTNETMRVQLDSGGHRLVLVLNTGDEPTVVDGVGVGAHDFTVVED
ncbi:MAG: alpha-amylase family glycosyl hydrolase [Actinomycetota bacterium]